eukprot:1437500-Rhodomonas_salina.3
MGIPTELCASPDTPCNPAEVDVPCRSFAFATVRLGVRPRPVLTGLVPPHAGAGECPRKTGRGSTCSVRKRNAQEQQHN